MRRHSHPDYRRAGSEAERQPGMPPTARSPRPHGSPLAGFPLRRALFQRGFSLLEVIAAVLLLAIAFAALMRVAGSSLNLSARAAERSEAAMWARSLLDSAFVLEPIRLGHSSGRFDPRYRWQLAVTPWNPVAGSAAPGVPTEPTTPPRVRRLDLDVLWDSGGHHYSAHFSTLRLAPPGDATDPAP